MNTAPILYLEDDDNDSYLLQRAFKEAEITNSLIIVTDGPDAQAYLSGTGAYGDRAKYPLPCLVLLDISMPGKSGLELLKWMRQDPRYLNVPVVVFTSSHQEADITRVYSERANGYLVKPNKPEQLLAMVKALRDFWILYNHAPAMDAKG